MEQPQPDDKNWTWVLERPCPDCRFDASTIARHTIGATLRTIVGAWQEVLSRGELVRQRPPRRPDGGVIWSALEYGCHVRDVCILFAERLRLLLTQPDPTFLNWDQDATAIAKRYWEDDPMTVREALRAAGGGLADALPGARPPVGTDRHALRRGTVHRRIVWSVLVARSHPPLVGCDAGIRGAGLDRSSSGKSAKTTVGLT